MRTAFFECIHRLASEDSRVELLVGDLGYGAVEPFVEAFPDRFTNVGVAEQNLIGVATGLALTGSVVFAYSIGNFPTLRCLEQLRNDACYHNANVKVVSSGAGLAYGALGISHHAIEDIAVTRALPGLLIACPGDPYETTAITEALAAYDGPGYLRMGKKGEPNIHAAVPVVPPGSSVEVATGDDIAILVIGSLLPTAIEVRDLLATKGVSASVRSMPWLWPFDEAAVLEAAQWARLVVTVEEHSIIGGLGSAAAEVLADIGGACPLLRVGLPRQFTSVVGDHNYLRRLYGLDPHSIEETILSKLKGQN